MKEPFVTIDTLIDQTKIIGDMELQAYLTSLGNSQKTDFINSNISDTINAVSTSKVSKYTDMMDQATGADNNITSAAYYLARTRDLTDLAKDIDTATQSQLSASVLNHGLSLRQHEINEWANSNKLDTLYFLQILFISLSLVGFLAFLVSNGLIGQGLFTFLAYTIGIIAALVLLLRWRYTNVKRDSRYWHKARFSSQKMPTGPSVSCSVNDTQVI
jgi:hypothetical protein